MPRNPDSPVQGSASDPDFRRRRAAHARSAQNTPDYHVQRLVESAPTLTPEQAAKVAALLPDRDDEDDLGGVA
jgi:hypothetical protein